jgi:hypothetical protein
MSQEWSTPSPPNSAAVVGRERQEMNLPFDGIQPNVILEELLDY